MPELINKSAKFYLASSSIDEFAVFEDNNSPTDELIINSTITFGFDINKNLLSCTSSVVFIKKDKPVVKCTLTYGYRLHEETLNGLTKGSFIEFPKELLIYFGSKTYGGLRGVLLAKLEHTSIKTVLPLTNLNNIIKEPLRIKTGED